MAYSEEQIVQARSRIATQRMRAGLNQRDLHYRSGVPLRTLQRYESGEVENPNLRVLVNVAYALGCDCLSELIEESWLHFRPWERRRDQPGSKDRPGIC